MATLYVTEQGARLEKEYRRLLVTKEDEVLLRTPLSRVSHVVLVGQVGATTPALLTLLDTGVGLTLINQAGQLRGHLLPPAARNIPLRHKQYERAQDAAFCLEVARAVVGGKLRNQRTLARRLCRSRPGVDEALVGRITAAIKGVGAAEDMAALRGLEGAGARAYFAILRQALEPGWGFEKRERRPPADPVNALLSLAYTLLGHSLMAALEVVGLDPYDGFFHADKYGRPALALDLVEEFRSVIGDSLVLTLVNKNILEVDDFEKGARGGVYLSQAGLRKFFQQYTARLNTRVLHPLAGRQLTYQQVFEVQARLMRKVIEGEIDRYAPFVAK